MRRNNRVYERPRIRIKKKKKRYCDYCCVGDENREREYVSSKVNVRYFKVDLGHTVGLDFICNINCIIVATIINAHGVFLLFILSFDHSHY